MKPQTTTPQQMIEWLDRRIKQHEVRANSKNAAKMEKAIKACIERTLVKANPLCGLTKDNIHDY